MWNMIRILLYLVATLGGIKQQSYLWGTLNAPLKLDVYKYCQDQMQLFVRNIKSLWVLRIKEIATGKTGISAEHFGPEKERKL